jgi:hypothetical protein
LLIAFCHAQQKNCPSKTGTYLRLDAASTRALTVYLCAVLTHGE